MNAEQKRSAVALGQLHKRLLQTIQILTMDVKFADAQMQKDKSNEQFWRRTVIRCVCALVEGTLSALKAAAPETAGFFGVSLTENDMKIVNELRLDKKTGTRKPAFLTPREGIKESIKVFAKAHAVQVDAKYDDPKFGELCETFQLRNRLMHPKNSLELAVTDDALKTAVRGWNWFDSALVDLLRQSTERLQQ